MGGRSLQPPARRRTIALVDLRFDVAFFFKVMASLSLVLNWTIYFLLDIAPRFVTCCLRFPLVSTHPISSSQVLAAAAEQVRQQVLREGQRRGRRHHRRGRQHHPVPDVG